MKKLGKYFLNNSYIYILILLSIIIYHIWFFNLQIIRSGDWGFYYKETLTTLNIHWFSLWLGDLYGRVLFDIGQAPTYALYGYFAKFFSFDYTLSERIIYLWPIAILTPLFSYFLLRSLSLRPIAAFVGALFYAYNTYFFLLQTSQLTLMGAFSFAPIILLMYIKTLNTKKIEYALITGLLLATAFAYEPRATYIIVWILLFFAGYSLWLLHRNLSKKSVVLTIIMSAIPIIVLGLLNVYWIGAFLQTQATGVGSVLGRDLFGSEFYHISYSFTLFHPFWTGKQIAAFQPQQILLYFWMLPFVAFIGLLLNKKNSYAIFFGFISLLGIFLSKQVGHPFTDIYPWLYAYLPGFNAFREASKFYFLVALGYSVLIACFIDWLWENWHTNQLKIYGKYFLTFCIIISILWNTKPLITGDYKTMFVSRKIDNDYLIAKSFIIKQPDYFRTFWMPQVSSFSYLDNNHPWAYWDYFSEIISQRSDTRNFDLLFTPGKIKILFMQRPFSDSALDLLSVKYIFVPLQDSVNDDDLFINFGEKRDYYINQLNKLPYLQKIDIGTKQIVVYKNTNFRPHFYITKEKEILGRENTFQPVQSIFIKPTQYELTLRNVKNPVYLTFSESYNPDWKLHVGEFRWYDVLLKKNYFLPDAVHGKNDVGFNTFFIDPKAICNKNNCKKNENGSYDITFTIYFRTQSYLYLGEIFSGSILLLIVGFLLIRLLKRYV